MQGTTGHAHLERALQDGSGVSVNWGLVIMSGQEGSSGAYAQSPLKTKRCLGLFRHVVGEAFSAWLRILFFLRTGKASCPRIYSGLKPLGQQSGWHSRVSNQNVWKALWASFNWFILGAEAPCITLASLENDYVGSLPRGCNPCGKGRQGLQKLVTSEHGEGQASRTVNPSASNDCRILMKWAGGLPQISALQYPLLRRYLGEQKKRQFLFQRPHS